jgi:uncharacterized protein YhfF
MVPADSDTTPAELWERFLASDSPAAPSAADAAYVSWQFGYGVEMGDQLVALVLSGRKIGTAGSLWSYELEDEAVPDVGDFSVITDGSGVAQCVVQTTAIQIVAFDDVDEAHARSEGEGDLSLAYWRESHWAFYTRELASYGRVAEHDMPIVCERFEVVFPLSTASIEGSDVE